jgi:TonB family protein
MFYRHLASIAAAACLAFSTTSSAEVLQPVRNWNVDFREDQCLASRDYGTADKPVILGIRPAPNGETYELLLARPHSGPAFATELKGFVDFGRGPIRAWLLTFAGKNAKLTVYQFRVSAAEMSQANSAATITFKPQGEPDISLALKSVPALLKSLQDCTEDLKHYWNYDGESNLKIATAAKGDLRALFTPDDYPAEAVSHFQQGSVQFLLLIDEAGSVAGCHVVNPSGVPVFDAMGCQVIRKRAKFVPARDASGKAMRSTVVTPPIVWRLQG